MVYIPEAAYETNPLFKKIESEFAAIIEDTKKFYDAMEKHDLDPKKPSHVFRYYYSALPDKDGTRITQYNEHLKTIEDLVKKIFKFRTVVVELQLISVYGPHTIVGGRTAISMPLYYKKSSRQEIVDFRDVGNLSTDNGVRYRVGYKSSLKVSKKGLVDESNAISVNVKLVLCEGLEPKHYVAIMLHEIGHNIDTRSVNIDVKNDSKMIKVVSTAARRSGIANLPNAMKVLLEIIQDRMKTKREYSEIFGEHLKSIANSIQYGGDNKTGEMIADALPTAYGYGPALIQALHILGNRIDDFGDFKETNSLVRTYFNYQKAVAIAASLDKREGDVHGSSIYRLKMVMKQLEEDLEKTTDSKLKKRIRNNLKELQEIIDTIVNDPSKSKELQQLLRAWVDGIQL